MIPDAKLWDNTSLTSRGLNCLGPRSLDSMFVKEGCPRKANIDFDTALILVENRRDALRLSPRCVECQAEHRMSQLLRVRGLLLEDGEELATCVFKGCDREPMYRSTHCAFHVLRITLMIPTKYLTPEAKATTLEGVTELAISGMKWALDERSGFEVFLNRKATGARIFALDLEGAISSNDMRQVAAIWVDDDRILFDLSISNPQGRASIRKAPKEFDFMLSMRKVLLRHVERTEHSGDVKTLAEAAEIIKNSGIRPTDYIMVWHHHYQDLDCLQHNLVAELGEKEVAKFLPPRKNVIHLNWFFKHNLGNAVYCSLELLFQLYFPTDDLRVTHHDAKIDNKKLIKMAKLGEKFHRGELTSKLQGKLFDWALQRNPKDVSV
jgi:ketosteroid isomerase-like protein